MTTQEPEDATCGAQERDEIGKEEFGRVRSLQHNLTEILQARVPNSACPQLSTIWDASRSRSFSMSIIFMYPHDDPFDSTTHVTI